MTWTKDLINTLDVFNVSTNLNLTNQHFVNMTKKVGTDLVKMKILPNVTLPEMQDVLGSLDIFNVTNLDLFNVTTLDIFNVTKFDIVNATRQKVADFEQEFHRNPLVAHLKTLSSSSQENQKNRTAAKSQESAERLGGDGEEDFDDMGLSVPDSESATEPPTNFLTERIKELQSFQSGDTILDSPII